MCRCLPHVGRHGVHPAVPATLAPAYAGGVSAFARAWDRLKPILGPRAQRVPRRWLHCPICDAELVGPFNVGLIDRYATGLVREPTREELVAKCPVHGRRPFNDPDREPPFRQIPQD